MPKKFRGENSKAVEARARKATQKEAEAERKQRQLEDEYWQEDDKNVLKKLHRKVCYLAGCRTGRYLISLHCTGALWGSRVVRIAGFQKTFFFLQKSPTHWFFLNPFFLQKMGFIRNPILVDIGDVLLGFEGFKNKPDQWVLEVLLFWVFLTFYWIIN